MISGYKDPFYNKAAKKYKRNITFEQIVSLFDFDKELRELFLGELLYLEQKFSSLLSHYFCEINSSIQQEYLNKNNYNYQNSSDDVKREIDRLIKTMSRIANEATKHQYIVYQRQTYNNVPLWATMKVMTFGNISKLYSYSKSDVRSKVAHEFEYVNETHLEQMIELLVDFRNVCAHHERLYCHKTTSSSLMDTTLHLKLNIQKKGTFYIKGKQDLFAVLIAFRYLLPSKRFLVFKKKLEELIKILLNSTTIEEEVLYQYMGFPNNWKDITRFKLTVQQ